MLKSQFIYNKENKKNKLNSIVFFFFKKDSAGATRLNHSKIDNTGEMISMTNVETTTNMVTNLESINEIELQESLFITSLQNRNSECFDDWSQSVSGSNRITFDGEWCIGSKDRSWIQSSNALCFRFEKIRLLHSTIIVAIAKRYRKRDSIR